MKVFEAKMRWPSHIMEHFNMEPLKITTRSSGARAAILGGILVVGCMFSPVASAQRRSQWQYQPSTPTLSPYMNLLQTNFGPVPNYYSLVRPRIQQEAFNRQTDATERSRSLRIQALEEGEEQQAARVSRTGKAGGFMEYLHYYPAPMPRSQRR